MTVAPRRQWEMDCFDRGFFPGGELGFSPRVRDCGVLTETIGVFSRVFNLERRVTFLPIYLTTPYEPI